MKKQHTQHHKILRKMKNRNGFLMFFFFFEALAIQQFSTVLQIPSRKSRIRFPPGATR